MDRSLGSTDEKIFLEVSVHSVHLIQMSPAETAAGRGRMEKKFPN